MLNLSRIRELLEPFGVALDPRQEAQLACYLNLLLRWNQRINLTSVRSEEDCVTRHFGESFYLAHFEDLSGCRLLDVGSGAGFPGLALKIMFPDIETTLLEPVAKKRAFLKEVVRSCGMDRVTARPERIEEIVLAKYNVATVRAVGDLRSIVTSINRVLDPGGRLHLWISEKQRSELETSVFEWTRTLRIPLSREREIVTGVLRECA